MDVAEIVKSAIKNVFASKLRTFLTMLGIIIGVGSVIAINSMGQGNIEQVKEQLSSMGPTLITVSLRSSSGRNLVSNDALTMDDYEYLRDNLDGYVAISPVYSSTANVTYLDSSEAESITMKGVGADYETISGEELLYGRYITEEEVENAEKVIIITDTFSESYFGYLDETIIGQEVSIKSWKGRQRFTIVGIAENANASLAAMYSGEIPEEVIVPIKTALRYFNSKTIASIVIDTGDEETVTYMTELIDEVIHAYRGTTEKYRASNNLTILDTISEVTNTMLLLITGIAGISLIVAGIGIMNIMLVTVTERTREIGIRKSIGAKNGDILIQFMVEAVIITVIGGLLGVLVGFGAGRAIGNLFGFNSIVTLGSVLTSLIISSSIGLIFGIYPARKASLLDPIDALTRI